MERQLTEEQQAQLEQLRKDFAKVRFQSTLRYYLMVVPCLFIISIINEMFIHNISFVVVGMGMSIILAISHIHARFKDELDTLREKIAAIIK